MKVRESFLLSVLQQSPHATAIYDSADLNIAFANQAMLEMWCADSSILGRTFCACFPGFKAEGFSSILKNVWKTGITYRATETPANIIDQETKTLRYFNFEYKALVDETGNTYAILHTASDVTEHYLARTRLKQQEEQLSFNNELDLLANTLAHDIKNPLAVLKMGSDFLSRNIDLQVNISQRWFETIRAAIVNIESIINQTLQLGRIRSASTLTECIAMDKKIANCIDEVKLIYPDQAVAFELGDLHALYAERGAVYQIFMNLIGNAVKYAKRTEKAILKIYSEKIDKGTVYFIEDNGIGIPEDELLQVFLANERGSNTEPASGSGIGLTLVKRLMERMGGTINLSSELGKGTIVRLFFPATCAIS